MRKFTSPYLVRCFLPAATVLLVQACSEPEQGAVAPVGETAQQPASAPVTGADFAFVNVNVVSMLSDAVTLGQTVLIEKGVIKGIVASDSIRLAANTPTVDGTGRYLMPALTDMHSHVTGPESLKLDVAYGVTTVRNLWGNEQILGWRDAVEEGDLFGPEIITGSPIIDDDPPSIPGSALLSRAQDADALVAQFKAQGYSFLKPYRLLKEDVYIAMMQAADKYGMSVEGHMPQAIDVAQAIELGQDVIEHATGFSAAIISDGIPWSPAFRSREMVALAARVNAGELTYADAFDRNKLRILSRLAAAKGTAVSVTFQAVGLRALSQADRAALRSHPQIKYLEPEYQAFWFADSLSSVLPGDERYSDAEIDSLESFVTEEFGEWIRIMHEEGVLLLGGTDAPNPGLFQGWSLHDELQNLVTWAGFTPFEALQTVTTNAVKFWRLDGRRGVVTEGAEADLLLLASNPLEAVSNTRAIDGVMMNGEWFDRTQLDALLRSVEEAFAAEASPEAIPEAIN